MKSTFKLKGLNTPWKAGSFNSIYATIEYGKEDWFHSGFDEKLFPDDRLKALYNQFKNSDENPWHGKHHKVVIEYEGFGMPINPVIKELLLDGMKEE